MNIMGQKMKTFHNLLIMKKLCKINRKIKNKDNSIQNFHGANKKYSLICKNRKIVIPKQLENRLQSGTIMPYATPEKNIQS